MTESIKKDRRYGNPFRQGSADPRGKEGYQTHFF